MKHTGKTLLSFFFFSFFGTLIGLLSTSVPVLAQTTPPPPPPVIATKATLTWVYPYTNHTEFRVYRRQGLPGGSGSVVRIGTTGPTVLTYIDQNLPYSTSFCWQVSAWNTAGESGLSPEACGTTKAAPAVIPATPAKPELLLQ